MALAACGGEAAGSRKGDGAGRKRGAGTRNVLDVMRVDQPHVERVPLRNLEQRNPIHAVLCHGRRSDLALLKRIWQPFQTDG